MSYFIDSNIFLRVLAKENPQIFEECLSLLTKIRNKTLETEFYTGNLVVAEIAWTLISYYKAPKDLIIKGLGSIFNTGNIKFVENYNFKVALKIYEEKNVKFIDALIASIPQIQAKEWTVISYDRDFDKIEVKRKEPKEIKEV